MHDRDEILRTTIARLGNDVLLRRWALGQFDDRARPIAEAEIARRGLDASPEAVTRLDVRDAKLGAALDARRRARRWRNVALAAAAIAALAVAAKFFGPAAAADHPPGAPAGVLQS